MTCDTEPSGCLTCVDLALGPFTAFGSPLFAPPAISTPGI